MARLIVPCPEPKPVFILLMTCAAAIWQAATAWLWRLLVHLSGFKALSTWEVEAQQVGGAVGLAAGFGMAYALAQALARRDAVRVVLFGAMVFLMFRTAVYLWHVLTLPTVKVFSWLNEEWLVSSALFAAPAVAGFAATTRLEMARRLRLWSALLLHLLGGVLAGGAMAMMVPWRFPYSIPWEYSDYPFNLTLSWGLQFVGMGLALRAARALDAKMRPRLSGEAPA